MTGSASAPSHPAPSPDLADRGDVEALVRAFYHRAFADDLLGPVFRAARMDLEAHLLVMCDFWQTVLFRAGLYRCNALQVHACRPSSNSLPGGLFRQVIPWWPVT